MAIRNYFSMRNWPNRPAEKGRGTMAYHTMLLLISLVLAPIFSWAVQGRPFGPDFPSLLALIFLQMELFAWLGARFFARWQGHPSGKSTKAILLRLAQFFGLVMIMAILINLLFILIRTPDPGDDWAGLLSTAIRQNYRDFLISAAVGIMFGTIVFFYFQWQEALQREQKLREEKLIFQYETLKSQVNPHFLFNSLNTLSSLVYQDPELSERFINKLSSIYRYILENTEANMASLSSEITFVKDYFYLQKIRDQEKIRLEINLEAADKFEVLPLSLQLLVENALKHNTASRNHPLTICISQDEDGTVVVKNKLQEKATLSGSSKIGLKNLSKRIKLTMNKEIEVIKTQGEFIVKVPVRMRLVKNEHEGIDH